VDFSHANVVDGCFVGADMTRAVLARANLQGADFRGAVITGIDFRQVSLQGVRLDYGQAAAVVTSLGAQVE
jgi:uncharacterized protein YjbI with pentapeptide repeats